MRTGCFCNPGDGEVAHEIEREDMAACFEESRALVTFEQCHRIIQDATGKVPNTVRVSLGLASNFADVLQLVRFLTGFKDVAVVLQSSGSACADHPLEKRPDAPAL